jgi:ankyrin repeat protein
MSVFEAAKEGDLESLTSLLTANPEIINSVNAGDQGRTPLIYASKEGHEHIVRYLIQAGADINQTNANGWTALHVASANHFGDIVAFLLSSGADRTLKAKNGKTAEEMAVQEPVKRAFKH